MQKRSGVYVSIVGYTLQCILFISRRVCMTGNHVGEHPVSCAALLWLCCACLERRMAYLKTDSSATNERPKAKPVKLPKQPGAKKGPEGGKSDGSKKDEGLLGSWSSCFASRRLSRLQLLADCGLQVLCRVAKTSDFGAGCRQTRRPKLASRSFWRQNCGCFWKTVSAVWSWPASNSQTPKHVPRR